MNVESAGGVIIKDGKILVVKFQPYTGVTFPKGHVEPGETYEQTALREVHEETGYSNLQIVKKLGVVTRPAVEKDGTQVIKDIHLFLMELKSEERGRADETAVWMPINEAVEKMLPKDKEFLVGYLGSILA